MEMGNGLYILVDGEPVPEPNVLKWGEWFETSDRFLAETYIGHVDEPRVRVSTVFVGVACPFDEDRPKLFETMIFGGPADGWMDRYETRAEALAGHERAERVAKGKPTEG